MSLCTIHSSLLQLASPAAALTSLTIVSIARHRGSIVLSHLRSSSASTIPPQQLDFWFWFSISFPSLRSLYSLFPHCRCSIWHCFCSLTPVSVVKGGQSALLRVIQLIHSKIISCSNSFKLCDAKFYARAVVTMRDDCKQRSERTYMPLLEAEERACSCKHDKKESRRSAK